MAESVSTKSSKDKGAKQVEEHALESTRSIVTSGPQAGLLALQRTLGNQAMSGLLQSSLEGLRQTGNQEAGAAVAPASPQTAGAVSESRLLIQAKSETGIPLHESVRVPMEQALGENLAGVRIHDGPASEAASESLGARAYTMGSDIHLGPEARRVSGTERNRLLAHEAVHTIQQGGQPMALQGKIEVSHPRDRGEVEADSIAESIMSEAVGRTPSRALGLRHQLRATQVPMHSVSRVTAPSIQRDLKDDYPVKEGNFRLDLKTESHAGAKSGMSGTVKFKANDKAPDADKIGILQVGRLEDLSTGKDYPWTGGEAARNKMMSPGGVGSGDPGYHVDVLHKTRAPRAKKGDADVSPYYIDDTVMLADARNKHGSKKGKVFQEASIWDYPGWNKKSRISFETMAKDKDSGHLFGTVKWGFTISDGAKGTVDHEHAVGRDVTLRSSDLAIDLFNKYYKNPGTPGAP
jgi:uncharacterized protein DUF4157